jgi:CxxC motif-containing protein (DUF1111 family)
MRRNRSALLALIAGWSALACTAEPKVFSAPPFDPSDESNDTISSVVAAAAGSPVRGLSNRQMQAFTQGLGVFSTPFTAENGLGPLFNSNSCAACHDDPTLGGYGDSVEVHVSAFQQGAACKTLGETGGPVVQQHSTDALGGVPEPTPDGATGPPGLRTTPVIFGLGLIDAIPDQTIKFLARIRYPDGVHGRAAILPNGRVGRFGRKAAVADLLEFNAGAYFNEMGVTNRLNPVEGTFAGTPFAPGVDPAPDPELPDASLAATDAFVRLLSPVAPVPFTDEARRGRSLFRQIRCTSCHIPVLLTGRSQNPALRFRLIRAYTDLLLHDMGPAEADMCNGVATPSEFRTQPLMGMQFLDMFMHDGLSETVPEAIQRHGGEAAVIRDRFFSLTPSDQAALVAFVMSL